MLLPRAIATAAVAVAATVAHHYDNNNEPTFTIKLFAGTNQIIYIIEIKP